MDSGKNLFKRHEIFIIFERWIVDLRTIGLNDHHFHVLLLNKNFKNFKLLFGILNNDLFLFEMKFEANTFIPDMFFNVK